MSKKWVANTNYTPEKINTLFKELISTSKHPEKYVEEYRILAKILIQRGVKTLQQAKQFTDFRFEKLHDPFLMRDMDIAVSRILSAVGNNEKIMIYGDYDVDGTTAVALMVTFLKKLTSRITYYIPDRYAEGYGISYQGIDRAEEENVSLIIALDCGIKALKEIDYAKQKSIDFIICDHHVPGEEIPNCIAILNPKQKNCLYPYKELSGCAIGFKLCQAIDTRVQLNESIILELLDFVAVSLACDIVPLTEENRLMVALGLNKINTSPRPSIRAILDKKNSEQKQTVSDLVFVAGPKINAAGRISTGKRAVELLLATNKSDIEKFVQEIHSYNNTRKETDKQITAEALQIIKSDTSLHSKNSCVLYQPHWHKGIVGIVASRIIEHYYRPTIILTQSGKGVLSGSARSVSGFNVYEALEVCSKYLLQFGGHKYAAGLTLKESQLKDFTAYFEKTVTQQMRVEKFVDTIRYDAEISLSNITNKLKQFIDRLEPFGPGNIVPTFVTRNVINAGNTKPVGKDNEHLKLDITQPFSELRINGIAFGLGHYAERIIQGEPFDIIYHIEINHWNHTHNLQVVVKDISFSDMQ